MTPSQLNDDDEIGHKVSRSWDDREWSMTISAEKPINEMEFAAALVAMGKDILEGKTCWDDAEDISSDH